MKLTPYGKVSKDYPPKGPFSDRDCDLDECLFKVPIKRLESATLGGFRPLGKTLYCSKRCRRLVNQRKDDQRKRLKK